MTDVLDDVTAFDDDFSDVIGGTAEKQTVRMPPAPGTTRGTRRGRGYGEKRLQVLTDKLATEMFTFGSMVGMGFHTTGYYIASESETFCKSLVELAAGKREWLDALEKVAQVGPGLTCGRTVLGVGAAFAVDRGRLDPEAKFLQFLGVTQAYMAAHDIKVSENAYSYKPPPGKFKPVGG